MLFRLDEGEFVKEVTWKDMLAGGMDAAFGYVTGSLKDVTFEIYAAEDIKAADGESSDYYKKDELVATITTDALGYARSEDLPLGKYYVKEKETADGYVLDGEIREVDLTYRDQNTPVVTYDEDWQNNRQKAKVTLVKKEKNTDRVLEGGVFALYTKNDILNAEGEVILESRYHDRAESYGSGWKNCIYGRSSNQWQLLCKRSAGSCRICNNRRNQGI